MILFLSRFQETLFSITDSFMNLYILGYGEDLEEVLMTTVLWSWVKFLIATITSKENSNFAGGFDKLEFKN